MQKTIRRMAFSAIFTALISVLIVIGGLFDVLDLTVSATCSLLIAVAVIEIKGKYPLLIYFASSVLCAVIMPMTTATLYYIAFFGYYPILRVLTSKLGKLWSKIIGLVIFNGAMAVLLILFKTVFSFKNEPLYLYIVLILLFNLFYFIFDYAIDVFAVIYRKKLKNIFKIKI